jgi:hypothetical protein
MKILTFVEGYKDSIFIESLLANTVKKRGDQLITNEYAEKKPNGTNAYLKTLKEHGTEMDISYIFLADLDPSKFTCNTHRKRNLCVNYKFLLEKRTVIVHPMIEGWYISGISKTNCKKLRIPYVENLNKIDKDYFKTKIAKQRYSIDFYLDLLKFFSIEEAKHRSESFNYFIEKLYSLLDIKL